MTPKQGSSAAIRRVVRDKVSQPMSNMQRRLDVNTQRHTAQELCSRQNYLNQCKKDRRFCVAAFSNKATQYHAGDLFDIETCAMDISEHAKVLVPSLELKVCQPLPTNASGVNTPGEPMDCSDGSPDEQIAPLLKMIGKLHCLVDNCIHLQ